MRRLWLGFLVTGLLGAAVATAQPKVPTFDLQRDNINAIMSANGYRTDGVAHDGDALVILKFSSAECRYVRVLPVSLLFQETPLLRGMGATDDIRQFIYLNEKSDDVAPRTMAASHLAQTFLQMIRPVPFKATDTMLYIDAAKECGKVKSVDWSKFWDPSSKYV